MTKTEHDDAGLEALFAEARAHPPRVPDRLLARVAEDAQRLQPRAARATQRRGWWAVLGGLPGLGGLVTATCVGFWLGVAPPEGVPDFADQMLGSQAVAEEAVPDFSGFGWDSEEG
ncbi:hypothetical protein FIU94_10465 [Sulfitobacter sp. THAF37]|uniref:hypothetical protein n=1 Tax=Sulfitobacter sp. THAF37 TaxID=2587855 RepID=UPI0012694B54|nr:hypothetical protein [Sulfitobacter sp. THAF37]QFT59248.1 hypothetical protein FIU94_10465 [Sulfitobacter sp. THAF37]